MARLTQDNLGARKVHLTRNNLWALEVRRFYIKTSLLPSPVNSLGRVGNPTFSRANPPLKSRILMGNGGNLLDSKVNLLLSPHTKEGNPLYSKPSPLLNPFTLGDKWANRLCSQIQPAPTLIVNLDKLANHGVNQLSSPFDQLVREDNLG